MVQREKIYFKAGVVLCVLLTIGLVTPIPALNPIITDSAPDPYEDTDYVLVEETWEPDASGDLVERITTEISSGGFPGTYDVSIIKEVLDGTFGVIEEKWGDRTFFGDGSIDQSLYVFTADTPGGITDLTGKETWYYLRTASELIICTTIYEYIDPDYIPVRFESRHTYDLDTQTPYTVWLIYLPGTPPGEIEIPTEFPPAPAQPVSLGILRPGLGKWIYGPRFTNLLARNQDTPNEINRALIITHRVDPQTILAPSCEVPEDLNLWGFYYTDTTFDVPPGDGFTGLYNHWAKCVAADDPLHGNYRIITAWTSDRSQNPLGDGWTQFRVQQTPDEPLKFEASVRIDQYNGHQDTITLYNYMYQAIEHTQAYWNNLAGGDYIEERYTFDGSYNPISYVRNDCNYI